MFFHIKERCPLYTLLVFSAPPCLAGHVTYQVVHIAVTKSRIVIAKLCILLEIRRLCSVVSNVRHIRSKGPCTLTSLRTVGGAAGNVPWKLYDVIALPLLAAYAATCTITTAQTYLSDGC